MSQQSDPGAEHKEHRSYEAVKALSEDAYIVRRVSDGEQFIGHAWDLEGDFAADDPNDHLKRGAETPVWALLNHENLMSIVGITENVVFMGSGNHLKRLLLWDFADAGTLKAIFEDPPLYPTETGFLPESLCWHVVISILRALAWLHEGYREEYHIAPRDGDTVCEKKTWVIDSDWMPILHRNITPANIFFQHPKGSETYGFCKLGNFGKAFVSGHVNNKSGGPVVTVRSGDVPMADLRNTIAVEDIYTIPKGKRPYTKGTELHNLGAILHRMMTGSAAPPEEECSGCGCRHNDPSAPTCPHVDCHGDVNWMSLEARLKDYTAGLKEILFMLLSAYRGSGNPVNAIACLDVANQAFLWWKSETPDGHLFVEWEDDQDKRWKNLLHKHEKVTTVDGAVAAV